MLIAEGQQTVLTVADPTLEGDQRLEVGLGVRAREPVRLAGRVPRRRSRRKGIRYLAWRYTEARIDGSLPIGPGARGPASWPLKPGRYEVRLCLDDSYRCRGSAPFRVLG